MPIRVGAGSGRLKGATLAPPPHAASESVSAPIAKAHTRRIECPPAGNVAAKLASSPGLPQLQAHEPGEKIEASKGSGARARAPHLREIARGHRAYRRLRPPRL